MAEAKLLEMNHVRKEFPGVIALDDMHLDLQAGEVHAILGENGAGKSTLIKILSGIYRANQGEILINGKVVNVNGVQDAINAGVRTIHQELILVPYLSIAENIFLGNEILKGLFVSRKAMEKEAQRMIDDFGADLNAGTLIEDLTVAQQQIVEIIKAVSFNAKIIIMDEPTSSLSDKETEALFSTINTLKRRNIGIIYISHRMSELEQIADRVTVMRDGKYVATKKVKETNVDELVELMVGREIDNYYTRTNTPSEEIILKVEGLTTRKIQNVSFELRKGEILGFAGLVGAGRTETMQALFGIDRVIDGTIELDGKKCLFKNSRAAIDAGIVLVSEDRKQNGIFPQLGVGENITMKVLKEFIKGIYVNRKKEKEIAERQFNNLNVKAPGLRTEMASLSGGNQQKVIIGSWVATNPKVILLDEPTRGIDVGAKAEIYSIMDELTRQGVSIIMVSSELPEILGMSDRVVVMRNGRISGEFVNKELDQETIMKYAVTV